MANIGFKINTNEKILIKNTLFMYILQFSTYIFPLLTFPYLTRILGAENYGKVIFCNAIMVYFQLLLDFGFLLSATNECVKVRDDPHMLSQIISSVILAKVLISILAFLVLSVLSIVYSPVKNDIIFYFTSLLGIIITIFFTDFFYRGIEKMEILTYRVVISKIIYTILIFIFVQKNADYKRIPFATILSNLSAVVLIWSDLLKKRRIKISLLPLSKIISCFRESFHFFLSRIATTFYSSLNSIVIGSVLGNIELASYGVANTLVNSGKSFISPISDSIFPYMIKNKNFKLIKKIIFIIEPMLLLIMLILILFSEQIVFIFSGKGYENSDLYFRLMLPQLAVTLLIWMFGFPLFGAIGKLKYPNMTTIITALYHVVALSILYCIGKITVVSLILLTLSTEFLLCILRIAIFFNIRGKE